MVSLLPLQKSKLNTHRQPISYGGGLIYRSSRPRWSSGYHTFQWTQDSRSNPAENDRFLRAIKIRSTTSFGGEVKPAALYRTILQHVNDPLV
jgi:hypothetical protein